MDNYDYVMHGRVFSVKHIENQRVEVQGNRNAFMIIVTMYFIIIIIIMYILSIFWRYVNATSRRTISNRIFWC